LINDKRIKSIKTRINANSIHNDVRFRAKIHYCLACSVVGVYDSLRKPIVSMLTSLLRSFWRAMYAQRQTYVASLVGSLRCSAIISLIIYRYLRMNVK